MTGTGYDIIGDIHGHGSALIALLEYLGYRHSATGFQHATRQVIFLGDFIDRGEDLKEHRLVLDTVMPMVRNGHALAVMGNHEFNALAFHTEVEGRPLRSHTDKNVNQHRAFLNEYQHDPVARAEVLNFFYELPLWLEVDGLRAIHACWHTKHVEIAGQWLEGARLTPQLLPMAATKGTVLFDSIEVLLKGFEVKLPDGIDFPDKDGHLRNAVRIRWWERSARTLGEVVQPPTTNIAHAALLPIPEEVPLYAVDAPPCFIGHYWLKGKPAVCASNVACLDYSVAKAGQLVAYRWSGEQVLVNEHFTYVKKQ
ncbi:MAG: metallophosphoesterase [Parahaliea sp.]